MILLVEAASRLWPSGALADQYSGSKRWPMPGDSLEQLVKRADDALYREKSRRMPEKKSKAVPK